MLFTASFPEDQVVRYVNELSSYIKAQKEIFTPLAKPLTAEEQSIFKPFFNEAILKTTLFYRKKDGPIEKPAFLSELNEKGLVFSLDLMEAVTFMDVVVSYDDLEPHVQFHELVHAVQYQKLGLKQFANKYLRGFLSRGSYEKIPLEANARQLADAFLNNPDQAFSAEQDVQRWVNENRY